MRFLFALAEAIANTKMTQPEGEAVTKRKSFLRSPDTVHPKDLVRMTTLARSFPSLEGAEGIDPWNPPLFMDWATREETDDKVVNAAGFLLSVWEGRDHDLLWDLQDSLRNWSPKDREVFIAWCREPWWP